MVNGPLTISLSGARHSDQADTQLDKASLASLDWSYSLIIFLNWCSTMQEYVVIPFAHGG